MPFVGVPCTCRELNLPLGKPVVVQVDIPGNPVLLRSGDCPELQTHIGETIKVVVTEQGIYLVSQAGTLLYSANKT